MDVRRMARIAILASLCVGLRFAFAAFPNIKPITAIFLVLLSYMGWVDAFLVMGLTMIVTSFFMGFGVWVLWQILAYIAVLLIWGLLVLPLTQRVKQGLMWQSMSAGLMGFVYGGVISYLSSLTFAANTWIYWLNGLFFDFLHALSTLFFYPFIFYIFRRIFDNEKNHV